MSIPATEYDRGYDDAVREGKCKFNCRTEKANWLAGHWFANGQPADDDLDYHAEAERHYASWKRFKETTG